MRVEDFYIHGKDGEVKCVLCASLDVLHMGDSSQHLGRIAYGRELEPWMVGYQPHRAKNAGGSLPYLVRQIWRDSGLVATWYAEWYRGGVKFVVRDMLGRYRPARAEEQREFERRGFEGERVD